mmetsp:Transcript_24876/g.81226  ORF Transcript_24876/g.81226 Transcript_24876/m.81226 type:complete len:203 (-) Transcript_24876:365-973(-)
MAPPQWEPSKQGYESMFATNNLAHFLVSELLLPKIEETAKAATQARIVILVRRLHHMCTSIDQGGVPRARHLCSHQGDRRLPRPLPAGEIPRRQHLRVRRPPRRDRDRPARQKRGDGHALLDPPAPYKSLSFAPFRKSIPQGAATTMFCTVSPDIPKHAGDGYFFYFNRGPQRVLGVAAPGWADHLVHACEERQLELVKPYM